VQLVHVAVVTGSRPIVKPGRPRTLLGDAFPSSTQLLCA
jgi:hypothetical protein